MQVGFVGTGAMGNPMAGCLIEGVHNVTVHDIRREATTNLCEMGASWADSPRSVSEACDVVFTSLPGPTAVQDAVLDPSTGILGGLRPGSTYIDTTTNSPVLFRRVAEECVARGIEVLDAPVNGRPPEMTIMVGGDEATYTKQVHLSAIVKKNEKPGVARPWWPRHRVPQHELPFETAP